MVKPIKPPKTSFHDERVYCDYARLVRMQAQAESFSLLPHLRTGSVLSGRHSSLFRGRGLNFEELRHYQLGDDIRNLDWKVTLRTGKPHVRSYTEEKDRNVVICIDQRSAMFFSSTSVMKSVVAAEIAALCSWRILKDGDRVGFMIATASKLIYAQPQRTQQQLLANFKHIAKANQSLDVTSVDDGRVSLSHWLSLINRAKLKQSTIIVISDWHDCETTHVDQLKQLQQYNDVLAIMVSDPLERQLPERLATYGWVVGDGQYQLNINSKTKLKRASDEFAARSENKRQSLSQIMAMKKLPFIELSTRGDHIQELQKMVGGR
ncbi:DUF58 domain-containing protein [Vibrio taketomensis]|uniref:DUF58 domain-containing protein n=1 Tax=Vibrio taketomensis TaxID=2572923 RepID=UPI00138A4CE4|nr:DUF58 domain-containing protein [Vibrio taketomensis]